MSVEAMKQAAAGGHTVLDLLASEFGAALHWALVRGRVRTVKHVWKDSFGLCRGEWQDGVCRRPSRVPL